MNAVAATAEARADFFARPWPGLLLLGALWCVTINQLRVEWSINPQYAYGWAVPLLAAYLVGERWRNRPRAEAAKAGTRLVGLVLICAAVLLPLRAIQEAAPDWRAVGWAMSGISVALSLGFVYFAGGWPWLVHFAFPVLFFLVAVPWPVPLEQALVQRLMHAVTTLCVEIFGWFGWPAVQHGNVIEIGAGKVGVEEACSGVRSLQTMFMGGLFLGELFRLTVARRVILIGSVCVFAFICNVGRALALIGITAKYGPASAAHWHNQIGLAALAVSFAGLAGLAAVLRRGKAAPATAADAGPPHTGRILPRRVVLAGAGWLLLVELGTETWYRWHESGRTTLPSWTVDWPADSAGFREVPLSENVRAVLRYNEGRSAAWPGSDGNQWSMFFLRWNPGRASAQLARSHGPEVCLAANGAVLREDFGLRPMTIRGLELPLHAYLFTAGETSMYVFYCLWEDRTLTDAPASTRQRMTSGGRLKDVWSGNRNRGQQVIELAVSGPNSVGEAESATARMLEAVLRW